MEKSSAHADVAEVVKSIPAENRDEFISPPLSHENWSPIQTSDSATREAAPFRDGPEAVNLKQTPANLNPVPDDREIDFFLHQAKERDRRLVELREVTSSFLHRYAKFSSLREKVLSLRSRTKFQWNTCQEYRKFVSTSQNAFLEEAASGANPEKLRYLHEEVLRDHQAQNDLTIRTAGMETELANSEFDMQQKEANLANLAEKMTNILNEIHLLGHGVSTIADEVESQAPSTTPSSVDPHPLLQHYYEKAGDVNVQRERLEDLRMEYEEARATRQFQREQERQVDVSDADFENVFSHRHTQTAEALAEAIRVAEDAKRVCLNEGLDPDNIKYRKAKDSSQVHSEVDKTSNVAATPSSINADNAPTVETTGPPTSLSLGNQPFPQDASAAAPIQERVSAWIDDVELPSQQTEGRPGRSLSMSSLSSPAQSVRDNAAKTIGFQWRSKGRGESRTPRKGDTGPRLRLKASSSDSKLGDRRKDGNADPILVDNLKINGVDEPKVDGHIELPRS